MTQECHNAQDADRQVHLRISEPLQWSFPTLGHPVSTNSGVFYISVRSCFSSITLPNAVLSRRPSTQSCTYVFKLSTCALWCTECILYWLILVFQMLGEQDKDRRPAGGMRDPVYLDSAQPEPGQLGDVQPPELLPKGQAGTRRQRRRRSQTVPAQSLGVFATGVEMLAAQLSMGDALSCASMHGGTLTERSLSPLFQAAHCRAYLSVKRT